MNKFLRQTYVLLKKNLLLHVRNRTSTIAQCGIGILLILALYVLFYWISHSHLFNKLEILIQHLYVHIFTLWSYLLTHKFTRSLLKL